MTYSTFTKQGKQKIYAQNLEFIKVKKSLQFLETRQNVSNLGGSKTVHFKKFSTTHQLKFGKNHNPWYNM
jgi:hypothetical protein